MNSPTATPRFPVVSLVIVAINILIFVVELFKGGDITTPSFEHLIAWGANVGPMTLSGESWRLVTSMFLHIGIVHLAMNMYMLVLFGPHVERQFGPVRFTLLYLITGLFGGLASALSHTNPGNVVVAAGASGALMGISGGYLGHWLVAAARDEDREQMSISGPLAQTIGLTLLMGTFNKSVDNSAHIGGLIAGLVMGIAYSSASFETSGLKRALATVVISGLALLSVYSGVNGKPSEGLLEYRELKNAEDKEVADEKARATVKAEREKEIAADRKLVPPYVSNLAARGAWVPLPKPGTAFAQSPDGKLVYIASDTDNTLTVVDVASQKVLSTIAGEKFKSAKNNCYTIACLGHRTNVAEALRDFHFAGRGANAVAISHDGHFAFVTSMVKDALAIIDLQTNKIVASVETGKFPHAVAVSESGERAYVLNEVDNTVTAVDLTTRKVIARSGSISADNSRRDIGENVGLWLAANDKEIWVNDEDETRIAVLDAATLKEIAAIPRSGGYFANLQMDTKSGKAYILNTSSLMVVNTATHAVEYDVYVCGYARDAYMAISPDNKSVAFAEPNTGFIRVAKLRTGATVGTYPNRGVPRGLMYSQDGKQIFALNEKENGVALIDVARSATVSAMLVNAPELMCGGTTGARRNP